MLGTPSTNMRLRHPSSFPYFPTLNNFYRDHNRNANMFSLAGVVNAYLKRTADMMERDISNTLQRVHDLDNEVEELRLPMVKYLAENKIDSKPDASIGSVLSKNWPFFQADKSLLTRTKFKPKDFTPSDLKLMTPTTSRYTSIISARKPSVVSVLTNRTTPEPLFTDRTGALSTRKVSPIEFEAPAAVEYSRLNGSQTERGIGYRSIKMDLQSYKGTKVPKDLFPGLVKRKNLLRDIRNHDKGQKRVLE